MLKHYNVHGENATLTPNPSPASGRGERSESLRDYVKHLAALLLALSSAAAQGAPQKIEAFDAQSWQRLQQELPRPAAVVFSTTDCTHCPAAIAAVAEQLKKSKEQTALVVVVMDGDQHPGLLQDPHYRQASRLFVFKGRSAPLQYAVNPKWRGITPYVALLPQAGAVKLVLGEPSAQEFGNWLSAGGK
ncbi:MAG: hypothetical protein Q8Q81_08865 [Oxalobacteraceae bacterium]|nr:hypothetical protein [Oxalobacteraceae bacterium]